jgi:hypothetical protein
VAVTFAALLVTVAPALAADPCPPELAKAREARKAAGAKAKKPTSLAGQRQDVQASRGQEIQAPRAQARSHAAASEAIRQAEQACKAGDMKKSGDKAREALRLFEDGRR